LSDLSYRLWNLTTPVAYISNVGFSDPFISTGSQGDYTDVLGRFQYNYRNEFYFSGPLKGEHVWILNSLGPDRAKNQGLNTERFARGLSTGTVIYDPTNGTVSAGDIPRTGGSTRYTNPQ
jgi:hypothetical protein